MSEIVFPSTKAGNEVDRAVTAALQTIPGQVTQLDTRVTALENDVDDLQTLPAQLATIGLNLGDLTQLETEDKTDLVSAINEVKNNMSTTAEDTSYVDNYGIGADNVQEAIDTAAIVQGDYVEIDLSQYEDTRAFITDANKWTVNYSTYKCKFVPVRGGRSYKVYAKASNATVYALLKSNEYSANASVDYATGCGKEALGAGDNATVVAPSDATYMYVLIYTTADRSPLKVEADGIRTASEILSSIETIPTQGSKNLVTSGGVYDVAEKTGGKYTIDLHILETTDHYTISSANIWTLSKTGLNGVLYPLTNVELFSLSLTGSVNSFYAFLASKRTAGSSVVDFAEGYDSRITLVAGTSTGNLEVPSDAKYLYIYNISSSGDITENITFNVMTGAFGMAKHALEKVSERGAGGSSVSGRGLFNAAMAIGNTLRPLDIPLDSNGWMLPQTREHLNVIKKARQMQEIVWTPKADIPKNTSGTFPAGTPVTGITYSSTKEIDKYVGLDVSIRTYMTAVNNPYSLLYTEDISAAHSKSSWGKTYHGVNCRTYFGTVCSSLTGYATGQTVQWSTEEDKWMMDYRCMLTKNYDQSAQGLMIGDIYWKEGHNRLVTGLKFDASGNVTNVEITESGEGRVHKSTYTATALDNKTKTEGGIFYRNLELYKNRYYEPSEYVSVWDEDAVSPVYNNDICTFAGDMATFREGDTIVIDYNLDTVGSWTAMEIYKNDVLLDTVSISTSEHYVNLTSRNLAYGKYKARMSDGNGGYSDYTYWEILQAYVTVAANDDRTHNMTWTSANGKALSYTVCDITGVVYAHDEITDDERDAGTLTVDLYKQNKEQYASTPFTSGMYLKIHFEGDYGRVTNTPLEIAL